MENINTATLTSALEKRKNAELDSLSKLPNGFKRNSIMESGMGTVITIEIDRALFKSEKLPHTFDKLYFDIIIDQYYPLRPALVCFKNNVPPFYFADGRDFCSFIEEKWSCQTTLFKLIQAIPQKLDKYFNINNDQTIMGKFHLGRLFDIDIFVGIPLCEIYQAKDISQTPEKNVIIMLAVNILLQFEIIDIKKPTMCRLFSYCTLPTIKKLVRKNSELKKITLTYRVYHNGKSTQTLEFYKPDEFIKVLTKNMEINKMEKKFYTLQESQIDYEDVSMGVVEKAEETSLVRQIQISETTLKGSYTKENATQLQTLYLAAIDYFSASNSESELKIYLTKLNTLITNEQFIQEMKK